MTLNRTEILIRCYGKAERALVQARFPGFSELPGGNVIPDADIPPDGDNYQIIDPSGGRNFVMGWFRVTRTAAYLYREWPGNYRIPGIGLPGPWALPGGSKHPDGVRGPAQNDFGWGLLRYKQEIARLEGWADWQLDQAEPGKRRIEDWTEAGAAEVIVARYIDSRAANTPMQQRDHPVTLLQELVDIGLVCDVTKGGRVENARDVENSGVHLVRALLEHSATRRPRLYLAESCLNTRFALRTWTFEEGQKGACKDFVDLVLYFAQLGLVDAGGELPAARRRAGWHY